MLPIFHHIASPAALKRTLLIGAGGIALLLGVIGIVVPGLPTTPFVLLAAACFSRASPRLHGWLLNQRYLGPLIRDWECHRSLPRRIKWLAISLMLVMVLFSGYQFAGRPALQGIVLGLGVLGSLMVWRIPDRT